MHLPPSAMAGPYYESDEDEGAHVPLATFEAFDGHRSQGAPISATACERLFDEALYDIILEMHAFS